MQELRIKEDFWMQNELKEQKLEKKTEILHLIPSNAVFKRHNSLLSLTLTREDGLLHEEKRVILKRAFPFDMPWEYVAVLDANEREIGMIASLSLFDTDTESLLREELARIYYTPKIRRILSMKERYGFSYWQVETDDGEVTFTVQDTFRNLLRIGEDRLAIFDVDGNRFEIESLASLDRKSYKKIELYL